jgi:hypothetical protein
VNKIVSQMKLKSISLDVFNIMQHIMFPKTNAVASNYSMCTTGTSRFKHGPNFAIPALKFFRLATYLDQYICKG